MSLNLERLETLGKKRKELSAKQSKLIALKPINQDIEIEKFKNAYLAGKEYNPIFQYRPTKEKNHLILEEIQTFMGSLIPSSLSLQGRVELALWDVGLDLYLQEQARLSKDIAHLTGSSIYAEGVPQIRLVEEAKNFLKKNKDYKPEYSSEISLSSAKLLPYWQEFLKRFGFSDWEVILTMDIMTPTVVNRNPYKQIKLLTNHTSTPTQFTNLVIRSVMGINRAENGEQNEIASLMFNGFAGYQATEFGLRNYLIEKVISNSELDSHKTSAARYIAVYEALNGSFFKAFSSIVDYVGTEKALEVVARIKRGLTNTEEPGGYLKDVIYWKGYHEVKHHLDANPQDMSILYTGKIGLRDIPLVRELIDTGHVKLPKQSPEDMIKIARIMADEMRETMQKLT